MDIDAGRGSHRGDHRAPSARAAARIDAAPHQRQEYTSADVRPPSGSALHIKRIEQPDHGAVLLESGARYLATPRWTIVGDVKYDPVWSTLEVQATEYRKSQQTNFHPLIVSTGVALRF